MNSIDETERRRVHDVKAALQAFRVAADFIERNIPLSDADRRDIAASLRQHSELLFDLFENKMSLKEKK